MKISLNFLNRWENALFGKYNAQLSPLSKTTVTYSVLTAIGLVIIMFVMQMINASDKLFFTIAGIACLVALLLIGLKAYPQLSLFENIGSKVGYIGYIVVLFFVSLFLVFYIAMWALVIALIIVIGYFILVYGFGDGPSKKKKKERDLL